jgi:hypothetical protein
LQQSLADCVLWVFESRVRRRELEVFYTDEWIPVLEPVTRNDFIQMRWSALANDALAVMAVEDIGTGNKSEALRVIIAFVAKKRYGLELKRVYS